MIYTGNAQKDIETRAMEKLAISDELRQRYIAGRKAQMEEMLNDSYVSNIMKSNSLPRDPSTGMNAMESLQANLYNISNPHSANMRTKDVVSAIRGAQGDIDVLREAVSKGAIPDSYEFGSKFLVPSGNSRVVRDYAGGLAARDNVVDTLLSSDSKNSRDRYMSNRGSRQMGRFYSNSDSLLDHLEHVEEYGKNPEYLAMQEANRTGGRGTATAPAQTKMQVQATQAAPQIQATQVASQAQAEAAAKINAAANASAKAQAQATLGELGEAAGVLPTKNQVRGTELMLPPKTNSSSGAYQGFKNWLGKSNKNKLIAGAGGLAALGLLGYGAKKMFGTNDEAVEKQSSFNLQLQKDIENRAMEKLALHPLDLVRLTTNPVRQYIGNLPEDTEDTPFIRRNTGISGALASPLRTLAKGVAAATAGQILGGDHGNTAGAVLGTLYGIGSEIFRDNPGEHIVF